MTSTEQIKQVGERAGALVVGVAAVEAFNEFVPEGHRPADILPGAKSVVVAGSKGPTSGAWQCPDHRVMEITGYDFRENVAIHVMSDYIEREFGYYAVQAPSLPTAGHTPPVSMMLAAVLAGLGTRSLAANIILHIAARPPSGARRRSLASVRADVPQTWYHALSGVLSGLSRGMP
jgi:epoxyqueuosine reductase QueG